MLKYRMTSVNFSSFLQNKFQLAVCLESLFQAWCQAPERE